MYSTDIHIYDLTIQNVLKVWGHFVTMRTYFGHKKPKSTMILDNLY